MIESQTVLPNRRWLITWDPGAVDYTDTAFAVYSVVPTTLRPCIAFDASTDESIILEGIVPNNYASGQIKLRMAYCANTSTAADDVRFDVYSEFRTPGASSEALNSDNFDATADSVTGTFSSTAYDPRHVTVILTPATAPYPGDLFRIKVTRDANHGTDDSLAADCLVTGFELYEAAH